MSNAVAGSVVVGLDPRWNSFDLLRRAVDEARRRTADLAVVSIVRPLQAPGAIGAAGPDLKEAEAMARRRLAEGVAAIADATEGLRVSTHCLSEGDVSADLPLMSTAVCLVVGTRGEYGRRAFDLHSVSRRLLTSTDCPILTVPERQRDRGRGPGRTPRPLVVAGVGEHGADAGVVRAAFREAEIRRADLLLLHTFHLAGGDALADALRHASGVVARAAEGVSWASDCRASLLLTHEDPVIALVRQTADADLVVVGTRPGALSGLVRDSVSRDLLASAQCPVLVIRRHRKVAEHEHVPEDAGSAAYL